MRVLIAEDNVTNQLLCQALCGTAGIESVVVGDGEAAVAAVADGDFDLVLMDIHMPKLSGIDASTRIRRLPGKQGRILIFALTADVTTETSKACRAAGVNEILTKPLRPGQLVSVLKALKAGFGAATFPAPTLPTEPPEQTRAFESRLMHIIAGATPSVAGRVNLLGLTRIQRHFGDAWPRVAENVERIVRSTIERRLSPADAYSKADDFDFIIIFGDMSPNEGQLKCMAISEEIIRKLVGEEGASLIEVKAATVQVDGRIEFKAIDGRAALAGVRRSLAGVEPWLPAGEGSILADLGPPDTGERIEGNVPVRDPLAGVDFLVRPVWDSIGKTFAGLHCLAFTGRADRIWLGARLPVAAENDIKIMMVLDQAIQSYAKATLASVLEQAEHQLVSCPVHYETLAGTARRANYARGLNDLPRAGLRRFLIEVVDVPCGIVPARLREIISPLRACGVGILVGVELRFRDFAAIKANDINLVGADISAHSGSALSLIYQIKQFQFAAQQAGLTAYLHGIQSTTVLDAVRDKFRFLDGDAVASAQERGDAPKEPAVRIRAEVGGAH